jgi:hypothetical protein
LGSTSSDERIAGGLWRTREVGFHRDGTCVARVLLAPEIVRHHPPSM